MNECAAVRISQVQEPFVCRINPKICPQKCLKAGRKRRREVSTQSCTPPLHNFTSEESTLHGFFKVSSRGIGARMLNWSRSWEEHIRCWLQTDCKKKFQQGIPLSAPLEGGRSTAARSIQLTQKRSAHPFKDRLWPGGIDK